MNNEGSFANKLLDMFSNLVISLRENLSNMETKQPLSLRTLKLEHLISLLLGLYTIKFVINFLRFIIKLATYILFLFIIVRIILDITSNEGGLSNYTFEEFKVGIFNIFSPIFDYLKNLVLNSLPSFKSSK